MAIPPYLENLKDTYGDDPREANRLWFKDAGYGLFIHYGLYSIIGRHEWVQLRETIPVAEYERYAAEFTAEGFDAEKIAAFAEECGMRYITVTTRHHDSFCLWDTEETGFNSMNSPAKRDLISELASACNARGLGLFLYYSHGRDWRHPHAPNNDEWGGRPRPEYDPPDPTYAYGDDHDLEIYLKFMERQIVELLTKYPTAAGIWLDGIAVPLSGDHTLFRCQDLYDLIHRTSPHALVSYKQGLLGTEDFFTPEHYIPGSDDNQNKQGKIGSGIEKKIEVNTTMIYDPISWGYQPDANHKTADQVLEQLHSANAAGANLLLNTGPMPDGSIDPVDREILLEVGEQL